MFVSPDVTAVLWVLAGSAGFARGLWTLAAGVCLQKRSLSPVAYKAISLYCLYRGVSHNPEAALILTAGCACFCALFLAGALLARRSRLGYRTFRVAASGICQADRVQRESTPSDVRHLG
jgi:hypothetical protein